jgi:hypothetical protein
MFLIQSKRLISIADISAHAREIDRFPTYLRPIKRSQSRRRLNRRDSSQLFEIREYLTLNAPKKAA